MKKSRIIRNQSIRIFATIFSRPLFFGFFYYLNKLCLHGMNRMSAGFLPAEQSGEKLALKHVLSRLPNNRPLTILDAGGNTGEYSDMILSIAKSNGQDVILHIIDPSDYCSTILTERFKNKHNVFVHNLAISDEPGNQELYFRWSGAPGASLSESAALGLSKYGDGVKHQTTIVETIDGFCLNNKIEKIDYLKLDIEGHEYKALQGAKSILASGNVSFIQIEIGIASLSTKSLLFDIWNLLYKRYDFFLVLNKGLVKIKYNADLECFSGASNFILTIK